MDENQNTFATQMDTVYNNVTSGPFLQTFKFVKAGFLFAIYHDFRTAQDMTQGVNLLYQILGTEVFQKYCSVILTDRGSESSDADGMERDPNGNRQKGTLENKHRELRYILPHKADLRAIGLNMHSSFEMMHFLYPDLHDKFIAFDLTEIEKDNVILKPYLLKK